MDRKQETRKTVVIFAFIVLLVPVCLAVTPALGQIYCVSTSRDDVADGRSEKMAWRTITQAAKVERLELERKGSITQYGITWTFDKPAQVGQFVNGDYYVVGAVTITAIDPKPLVGTEVPESELDDRDKYNAKNGKYVRNGSMLNPPAQQRIAYDSGIRNWFRRELLAVPPIRMKPGDSLVSTISLKFGEKNSFPYHGSGLVRGEHDNSPVKTAAVLTCMAEPQLADAFRPAFCDKENNVYLARSLRRELLYSLPKPANTPKLETWVRVFQRPWVNTGFFGFEQAMENMPHYGQWVGQAQSMAGLMLMLDFTPEEKEPLLINVVQVGIDYWGAVRNGHPGWQGWGGHGSGRKFPIVLAGILLGDEQMASPTKTFPKVEFGEDNQTMFGKCWTGADVVFAGHSGISSNTGEPPRPKWGPYEHLPPSEWTKDNFTSECYRRANTCSSWVGQVLVMRMMRAEKQWNHDAFFAYVDRWMSEDDAEHRHEIAKYFTNRVLQDDATWGHQSNAWEPFVKTMWQTYGNNLPPAPLGGQDVRKEEK